MICNYDLPQGKVGNITRLHLGNKEHVNSKFPNFFQEFLVQNKPCIVTADELIKEWVAFRDWITPTGDINFEFLLKEYGNVQVPVTEITDKMTMDYGGMNCSTMLFKEYVQYWINRMGKDDTALEQSCLYLKDWHILNNCGEATEKPYETVQLFSSDWLNETNEANDFRFVYMGPKGTWTPFHADVYGSFSWSINITGRKKWRLYPPGKENALFRNNSSTNQIIHQPESPGIEGQDFMEVMQEKGETIFVPSGWHHIVWNETDVISINHNWFNASNICYIWHQLQQALELVKIEINDLKDCDEFAEQCQLILKANHGMDYNDFCELIRKIWVNRRKNHQDEEDANNAPEGCIVGEALFDLRTLDMTAVEHVISDHLLEDEDVSLAWKNRLLAECQK